MKRSIANAVLSVLLITCAQLATAKANIEKDCKDAAGGFKVPPSEAANFSKWCQDFERQCYDIEEKSAASCGGKGSTEAAGLKLVEKSGQNIGTNTSYQAGTAAGQKLLAQVIARRQRQIDDCNVNLSVCAAGQSIFQSSLGAMTLKCSMFTPESDMWSPLGKSAKTMCDAIDAEITRVKTELAMTQTQDAGMRDVASKTTATSPMQCGITGCVTDDQGNSVPLTQPVTNDTTPVSLPSSNQDIRLPSQDSRACGIFGCVYNTDDHTWSPKNVPSK